MTKELSDKTRVVVTRSTGNHYVTETQAEAVISAMSDKSAVIRIGNDVIAVNDITGVVGGDTIKNLERRRLGEWECKYGYWHQKNQQCGHGLI